MKSSQRFVPSPAMIVALIALFVALGGSGYAAVAHHDAEAAKSRKLSQLSKDLAALKKYLAKHAVPKANVASSALTAASATSATSAGHASSADTATSAASATSALTAGGAPPTGAAGGALAGSYPNPGLAPLPAIKPITLENAWKDADVSDDPLGYYKDQLGIVHLQGAIEGGNGDEVAFELPAGYRDHAEFSVNETNGASEVKEKPCALELLSGGEVAVDTGCQKEQISLDGISYRPTS